MKILLTLGLTVSLLLSLCLSVYAADCNNGGRYEDNSDGTVTDCRGGLIWLKNANCLETSGGIGKGSGYLTWYDAMKWAAGLGNGICSLADGSSAGDWRLPTETEWMAMTASAKKQGMTAPVMTDGSGVGHWVQGNIFDNVQSAAYWSETTTIADPSVASYADLQPSLFAHFGSKVSAHFYVWPVRGGRSGTYGHLFID